MQFIYCIVSVTCRKLASVCAIACCRTGLGIAAWTSRQINLA